LASRRFWAELGGLLSAPGARLQILDEDFGVPWELAPVPDAAGKWVPIASLAPVVRPRSITTAAPAPARSFLLLADAAHPGALDEVAALEEALASLGAHTRIALALDDVEDALGAGVYDVVHYAGHQGPTEDATPSLSMAGGSLALARLLDGLHARPPALLFLHACSTLLPSRVVATDAASHTRYGALEPLERSNVPAVAGTLWDVSPPEDRVFIDVFYDHLVRHGDASAAMFAARSAASRRTHWAAWWPAYVLMSA
ncbi:MAG: CHAT domain-containing protein, partial [Sandaracinaceae bacterium]|nr:CHAT domain-containing protein [Sandaracinaceae bacterium]